MNWINKLQGLAVKWLFIVGWGAIASELLLKKEVKGKHVRRIKSSISIRYIRCRMGSVNAREH